MNTENIVEIEEDIEKYASLESLYLSEGGKILFDGYVNDVISCIETIAFKGKTLSHIEFIALSLEIKNKLDTINILKNSTLNKNDANNALESIKKTITS